MPTKIVIIGAGYAGVLTAKKLEKRLKRYGFRDAAITIIDRNPFHTMLTELHEVAANRVEEDAIRMDLKKIFSGRKVDVRLDTVESVDFEAKKVTGAHDTYEFDYLVISSGSKPTYFGVQGAEENALKFWSYDDAVQLKEHILHMFRSAARETDIGQKKKQLSFNVVGAGFTGVELMGELAEYVPILCEEFNIDPGYVSMRVIDVLSRPCPVLTERLSAKVRKQLNRMGVQVMMDTNVVSVGADYIELKHKEEATRYETETVVWAAGVESSELAEAIGEKIPSANRGRLKTDAYLRSEANDHVYVGGDNIFYVPEGEKNPVPQVVENCEQSAEVIAHNLVCAVTGKGEMHRYKPAFHGTMVSIGGRHGVARVGTPHHMVSLPSFFAMFTKHFINIVYFVQVLGWNKIWQYMKHEFFTIRHCRSFVGGHLSNRTPSFLLVPLRLWLGIAWLFEGVMKVLDGWFTTPKLTEFFNGANDWYNSILQGTSSSGDAVSSATGAATQAAKAVGTVLINFNFLNLFKVYFVSGNELVKSALNDFALKIDIPLLDTMINKVVLAHEPIQIAMQIFIVTAEILIGLALIGGLFTFPASGFSLVLQGMFVTTTGLYLGTFWMIFAAIAVLIGGGRIFGLDYYAMPWLRHGWSKMPGVRRWYLYHD